MTDHPVMRAVVEFLKTRPTKEQFTDFITQLDRDHPAERGRLMGEGSTIDVFVPQACDLESPERISHRCTAPRKVGLIQQATEQRRPALLGQLSEDGGGKQARKRRKPGCT
jgi:hypothetical protein